MKRRRPHEPLCLGLLLWLTGPLAADVRLPRVFGDNMMLQRDKPVPVWGWADAGDEVTVLFAGQTKTIRPDPTGAWRVTLDPLPASAEPRELIVRSKRGNRELKMENVLVGDVWFCSGDFGVYWEVFACTNATLEVAAADHPAVRLLKVRYRTSNESLSEIDGDWQPCSPKTITGFSALAYFFGRTLHRELKVPIGLIDCSYRYSFMRSWIAPEGFRIVSELQAPRERMDSWDSTTPSCEKAFLTTVEQVEQWLPRAEQAFREGKPIPPQPVTPAPIPASDNNYNSIGELSVAYHGMVAPVIPFAIRGVIWSQGENGGYEGDHADAYLRGICEGWRKMWGQGVFPFYYELLPAVGPPGRVPCAADGWVKTREGQIKFRSTPQTGMAVSYDVSDYVADARNRQDAGHRLALWALAQEYNRPLVCSGPIYAGNRVEGDRVIITYEHVGGGLMVGEKNGFAPVREIKNVALQLFAVAGADKQWHAAEARIEGATVVVRSDKVPAPVAVRYAWCANPREANLYNRDGLPAVPFRTDSW